MNELQKFMYSNNEVRVISRDGEPWFVAADVCRAMEIGNPTQACARLDDDEKSTTLISNESAATGMNIAVIVNEPGLYSLVLGSRKKEAKQFKRWVTHEVIPAIRKHGGYLTKEATEKALQDPDFIIRLATALKEERAKIASLESERMVMLPKAEYYYEYKTM